MHYMIVVSLEMSDEPDFIAFMENPEKLGMISLQRRCGKQRQNQVFSIRGLTFGKITPEVLFYGTLGRNFMLLGVLPDSNIHE